MTGSVSAGYVLLTVPILSPIIGQSNIPGYDPAPSIFPSLSLSSLFITVRIIQPDRRIRPEGTVDRIDRYLIDLPCQCLLPREKTGENLCVQRPGMLD